jgi:ABC-type Fe3+/spermidine/putrescine transport system ATPase subunit
MGVTTLYVTHDQMEALTMSDWVAVMRDGVFVEAATPRDVYLRPHSAFTATFLGETNLLAGQVVAGATADGICQVETPHGCLVCPVQSGPEPVASVWVACRPEGVRVTACPPPGENVLRGRIVAAIFAGDQMTYRVAIGDQVLQAKSDPLSGFHDGDQVWVQLPPERCLLLRRGAETTTPNPTGAVV